MRNAILIFGLLYSQSLGCLTLPPNSVAFSHAR